MTANRVVARLSAFVELKNGQSKHDHPKDQAASRIDTGDVKQTELVKSSAAVVPFASFVVASQVFKRVLATGLLNTHKHTDRQRNVNIDCKEAKGILSFVEAFAKYWNEAPASEQNNNSVKPHKLETLRSSRCNCC